jgi:hypothetical protein
MLCHARAYAHQRPKVHDGGKHDSFHSQLLDAVQQGFTLRTVTLLPLLLEQLVNVGIAPIGVDAL